MDGNIDEVRSSHKGPAAPPSLVAGVQWIDDSTAIWTRSTYDGTSWLTDARIDPISNLIFPNELRRKNHIWNGSVDVWQGGVSETGITVSSANVADGFRFLVSNHGTWTVDRVTDVPTVAQAGRSLNYAMRSFASASDATVNAGDYVVLEFTVEGYDYQDLNSQPQHLSFWAKSNTTGTYCLVLRNAGVAGVPDRSYVFEYTIAVADTWELKQLLLRDIPSGGTWDFTNGVGISLGFTLAAGATFQTTANAWQSGNFLATAAQTNLAAAVNNYMNIADVRLTGGTVRSPIIVRSFQDILVEAQRRFVKTFPYGTKPAQASGTFLGAIAAISSSASTGIASFNYPTMRATPAVTRYSPTQANTNWRSTDDATQAVSAIIHTGDSGAIITMSAADFANTGYAIHATADARF